MIKALVFAAQVVATTSSASPSIAAFEVVDAARLEWSTTEGAKIGARQAYEAGKYTKAQYECVINLPTEQIRSTIAATYDQMLKPSELVAARDFFRSEAGRIYTKVAHRKLLLLAGEPAPEIRDVVTDEILAEVKRFKATYAGEQTTELSSSTMRKVGEELKGIMRSQLNRCKSANSTINAPVTSLNRVAGGF
ncbi:hypothetical protein [Aquabacterium sp.]|uniref:hypothetical protein n=1 Tax=Aquabacterium sp. TaxID=1872578 RepID=UPI00248A3A7C|nr:hypothetical protein [Aquabacterium sp.]MDI1260916.1 hypothetical protein [Aquabacterium sp.]